MPTTTAASAASPLISLLHRNRGLVFPLACAGMIFVVLIPLPTWIVDLLLIANFTVAALILFTSIHVADPLEFSVFPSVLLGTTLFRLVLNVATTRLILTAGSDGAPPEAAVTAAGQVIKSFGHFVAAGSLAVGFVIFTILVVIQFVVITKGATRISEVAARFTLDSMPGKQMAVDADLNAGLIDETQAAARRQTIAREANFYGAMDGASKFVRGDAIAGVLITLVNIIGGLCVGLIQQGWSLSDTLKVFTILTIGDGLVAQLPAFIIAISAGLIITRSTARSDLGREIVDQLFGRPGVLVIATIFLVLLLLTGLPKLPLLILAAFLLTLTWVLRKSSFQPAESPASLPEQAWTSPSQSLPSRREAQKLVPSLGSPLAPSAIGGPGSAEAPGASLPEQSEYLHFEPLEVQVGFSLLHLLDTSAPDNLLARIEHIRRHLASRLGLIMPSVFVHDNVRLPARDYTITIRGQQIYQGQIHPGKLLAVAPGFSAARLEGLALADPVTQRPAFWIPLSAEQQARQLHYQVFASERVLPRHFQHVVENHAAELLSRQAVHALLSDLADRAPDLVAELTASASGYSGSIRTSTLHGQGISTRQIHKVLRNLLAEQVPICDLEAILEALSDAATSCANPVELTEKVRGRLAATIARRFCAADGAIDCLVLDPAAERTLIALLARLDQKSTSVLLVESDVESVDQCLSALAESIADYLRALAVLPEALVLLVGQQLRLPLAKAMSAASLKLPVLARSEILENIPIHALASFSLPERSVAPTALVAQKTLELFS